MRPWFDASALEDEREGKNRARFAKGKEYVQLVGRGRVDGLGITTTSYGGSETLRSSGDGDGGGLRQGREPGGKDGCRKHGDTVSNE